MKGYDRETRSLIKAVSSASGGGGGTPKPAKTAKVKETKPKIIITLGKYAPVILANLSQNDLMSWKSAKTFKDMNDGIKFNVKFGNHKCTCVPLVHTCLRNSNVKHRRYKQFSGNDAEVMMLKEALNI